MLQTKKFLFFNQETLPTGEGASSSSAQLQALEMTCCVAGRGCLLFGDAAGHVTFVDHGGHRMLSLLAHGHRVTALAHSCSQDMFVSVGDGHDPRSPQRKEQCKRVAAAAAKRANLAGASSPLNGAVTGEDASSGDGEGLAVVKIWRVSQDTLNAVCLHEFHAFGPGVPWQETAITTVATSDDCTNIALGLCTGQILLFRASSLPSAAALPGHSYQRFRPTLLQREEASPVTFLGFCPDTASRRREGGGSNRGGHTLFATSRKSVRAHSVVPQDRPSSGADRAGAPIQPRPAVILADEAGCEPGCATLMRARGELVVGRAEAVFCYSAEEPRRCYAIPDRKRRLLSFGHYLLLATENKGGKTVVSVFDTRKGTQYIAFNMVLKPSPGARRGIGGGVVSAARGGGGGISGTGIGGGGVRDNGDAGSSGGGGVGVAAKGEVPSVLYFAHDGESVFVVTTEHFVYRLDEKDTNTKLDILVRKHLYPMAIQLCINSDLSQQQQMEIHHMYGDHLYEKGEFDTAIEQYIKTIGSLNPSVVIGKFLDAHHVQHLMAYLEALHRTCLPDSDAVKGAGASNGSLDDANSSARSNSPHPLHTTLLLQCYTKLKDVDKLRQFILGGEGAVATFDVATAINVLRVTNAELALTLARKHQEHDWVFRILLEECEGDEGMLEDAMLYMLGLPAVQVVAQLQRWGKTLIEFLPDQMTDLLAALCTGCYRPLSLPSDGDGDGLAHGSSSRGDGVDDTQCDCKPEDFVHLLVNHPRHLRAFLEVIVAEQSSTSAMVGNTLLELLLQERDWDAPEERDRAVLELLDNHRAQYDKEHALVLVQIHECKVGELFLYEKLHRHDMIVQHHMETGNRRGMIDECKLRGGNEPALWMQVLRYLAKQRDAEGMESEIADVLQHLEQERHLAPLPVVQILQQSPHVTLGTVRNYLTNWIGHQQDMSQEDIEDLSAARAESRELKARVAEMEKRLQRLEKGDVHHEEDLEYDEYDQEEDKRLLSIRKALEQKAGDHEEFARSMAQAPDGFDVVAEYFGKGIVDVCLDKQRLPQHE